MEDDERDDWIGEEQFSGNFDQLQPNNGYVYTVSLSLPRI
jgi:hypothetical protein